MKDLYQLKNFSHIYQDKNILLVTGKRSYVTSGAQKIITEILDGQIVDHFNDFEVNPKLSDALKGVQLARKRRIEIIMSL